MQFLFFKASSFSNQPIGNWDVSLRKICPRMFDGASSCNQDLNSWDISSVSNLNGMFANASSFDHPIRIGIQLPVTQMQFLFFKASSQINPLADVSQVEKMSNIFDASSFNQDLSNCSIFPRFPTLMVCLQTHLHLIIQSVIGIFHTVVKMQFCSLTHRHTINPFHNWDV